MKLAGVDPGPMFVAFLNSEWYDGRGGREDRLLDSDWRAGFTREWGFAEPTRMPSHELETLRGLRRELRTFVEALYRGRSPSVRPVLQILRDLPPVRMRLAFGGQPPKARWVVADASWLGIAAEVGRSFLDFSGEGYGLTRLSRCDNEGCKWVFIDMSRNRSRRWCEPTICGNVSKVRAYRDRQRRLSES